MSPSVFVFVLWEPKMRRESLYARACFKDRRPDAAFRGQAERLRTDGNDFAKMVPTISMVYCHPARRTKPL